jgi:hypothetical protein
MEAEEWGEEAIMGILRHSWDDVELHEYPTASRVYTFAISPVEPLSMHSAIKFHKRKNTRCRNQSSVRVAHHLVGISLV